MSSTPIESHVGSRPRTQHRLVLWTESLELRRLLTATPSAASIMTFAIGLPIASLETGAYTPVPTELTWQNANQTTQEIVSADLALSEGQPMPGTGLATPAQTFQTSQTSISLPVFESAYGVLPYGTSLFGPSANGPASTLNPLGYGSETAVAAASEVARPTPGRSDRISSIVRTPPIIPLPHYESPESPIVAEPEVQAKPPVPPAQPPEKSAQPPEKPGEQVAPVPQNNVEPNAVPQEVPTDHKKPISLEVWDQAIDVVETDFPELTAAVPTSHAEASMAVGALLAAWGGWNFRSRRENRSRHRAVVIEATEAGPGHGSKR